MLTKHLTILYTLRILHTFICYGRAWKPPLFIYPYQYTSKSITSLIHTATFLFVGSCSWHPTGCVAVAGTDFARICTSFAIGCIPFRRARIVGMFLGLAGVDFSGWKLGLLACCLAIPVRRSLDRSWIPVHTIVFHQKVSDVFVILPSRSREISSSGNVEQSQKNKGSKSLHFVSAINFVKVLLEGEFDMNT